MGVKITKEPLRQQLFPKKKTPKPNLGSQNCGHKQDFSWCILLPTYVKDATPLGVHVWLSICESLSTMIMMTDGFYFDIW